MSYGQPCRSTTGDPVGGPLSAKATLRTPASICLSGRMTLVIVVALAALPMPSRATAIMLAAVPMKFRRPVFMSVPLDCSKPSPHRSECLAEVLGQQLRLFPRGEMRALVVTLVESEVGI